MSTASLSVRLAARIRAEGPLPLPDFMAAVTDAYYARGEAFGSAGDFITAPEISQAFGEVIGLWCAVTWQRMGSPKSFALAECGPGRGTLMADALRAANRVPGFRDAAQIHLVEHSAALREQQRARLEAFKPMWHDTLAGVPAGPMILLANEFLDALPIQQFERTSGGWQARSVDVAADGTFQFTGVKDYGSSVPSALQAHAKPGDIFECSPAVTDFVGAAARRIARDGGAALFVDYGHKATALGDTLQAVKNHKPHPVLDAPGTADLTAHVDFAAAGASARAAGAKVFGPIEQGIWLKRLGIAVRAVQLAQGKDPATARNIESGIRRLTEPHAMGALFKVMAVAHPSLAALDGFEQDAPP